MLMRILRVLAAGAGPLLFAQAFALGGDWSKDFNISGTADVRMEVDDGRVNVTGIDAKRVEVRVYTNGWQMGPNGVQVIDRQTGDHVEIDVRVPRNSGWFNIGNRSIRVEVRLPNGAQANIHTHDGSVVAEGVRGVLHLRTGDGHIEATGVEGSLEANTGDGSIRVRGRLDNLTLRTGDGSIEAEMLSGSKMGGTWDVTTGDGHVTLRVPASLSADLDAHTGDGQIEVDFPVTTSGKIGGHDLRGKVNGGGPLLRIRTGDGSIKVLRG